ncbi:MAG TPA: alpha/beta hydrolase [Candidatus Obscuribacterales bacterium]
MLTSFLPSLAKNLTEPASIALAQSIECQDILTPLCSQAIATAYVHQVCVQQDSGGTPILLLHGFDSSVFEFRRLLPLLATQSEAWAVDLLGFGFTDRTAGHPFSPTAIKTHLYAFWKTLINQPVILVGASMGGAAAIDFTLAYPECVQKLVLIDSAGFRGGPALGKFLVAPVAHLAAGILRSPKVRDRISRTAYYDPTFASPDAQLCAALHLELPGWREALAAFTQSGGYRSFKNKLAHIEQQTLILWGTADKILGTGDAIQFQQAIANSQLVWIPECGHVPHLEKPQLTAQHILEFAQGESRQI